LVELLNQCIYQVGVFNQEQVELAKVMAELDEQYAWAKGYDFDSLGLGCEGQLIKTNSLALSIPFRDNLDRLISDAKKKLAPG